MKKNVKKITILVLSITLGIICMTVGATLAIFKVDFQSDVEQTITANSLTFKYTETSGKGRGITLTDAEPVEDNEEEKSNNNYFDFNISADVNEFVATPYVVTARMNEGSSSELGNILDIYLTEVINKGYASEHEEETNFFYNKLPKYNELEQYSGEYNYTEKVLFKGIVTDKDYDRDFRLRMWIDDGVELDENSPDYNGLTFSITVNVYAQGKVSTLSDFILADNEIHQENPTLGVLTSTTNENGLFKKTVTNGYGGQDGDTYYFRGNVTNNVVEFADYTWRVVRINEDGTIRLILDDKIITGINGYEIYRFYHDNNAGYNYMYYSNTDSIGDGDYPDIKYTVDKWYKDNITDKGYGDRVASGNYFCEAANVVENDGFRTAEGTTHMTIRPNYTPTLSCIEDANGHKFVSGPVGLITYDEAAYAGAVSYITGNTYYLNRNINNEPFSNEITDTWWTMTPGGINTNDNNIVYAWAINSTYDLTEFYADYRLHVRPVINIKADQLAYKDQTTGHYIVP